MKYAILLVFAVTLAAQEHNHARMVHGVPGGVPDFCANPTVTSAASGAWSDAATWSSKKVPSANDRVAIAAGNNVVYDASSEVKCLDVRGHLSFATAANTRLKTNNLMVEDQGYLEIGSVAKPITAHRRDRHRGSKN